MIKLENLSFTYPSGPRPALRNVTMELKQGSFAVVRGRNGSGKTTLLRVLGGIAPRLFDGEVQGQGRVGDFMLPGGRHDHLAESAGVLLDNPWAQITGMKTTVFGEIAFPLETRGWEANRIRERVDKLLHEFGLVHLASRSPSTLSGGETQRVVLAATLAPGPRVLLLDEPELHLDRAMTQKLLQILEAGGDGDRTTVCATHLDDGSLPQPDTSLTLERGELATVDRNPGSAWAERKAPELTKGFAINSLSSFGQETRASGRPTLAFEDVTFRYADGPVTVDRVSFRLCEGQHLALVGPNGAGKTTLARIAVGLLRPSSGRVLVGNRDIVGTAPSEVARTVGIAFQNPDDQLFRATVEDELGFGPDQLGFPDHQKRRAVGEAVQLLGLNDVLRVNPRDLSWSRRRLVAIASTVAMEPKVLILDEPTAGLDDLEREHTSGLIRAWCDLGRSVLTITHDVGWLMATRPDVVQIDHGRLVA